MAIGVAVSDGKAVEFLGSLAVVTLAPPIVKAAGQQLTRLLRVALLKQDDTKARVVLSSRVRDARARDHGAPTRRPPRRVPV